MTTKTQQGTVLMVSGSLSLLGKRLTAGGSTATEARLDGVDGKILRGKTWDLGSVQDPGTMCIVYTVRTDGSESSREKYCLVEDISCAWRNDEH